MCFSATASFALAGALLPAAAIGMAEAARRGPGWWAIGLYPLAFATQQAAEGLLWQALEEGDAGRAAIAARGFVVFSHLFWPAWVPVSAWLVEPEARRRRYQLLLAAVGGALGLSMVVPILLFEDWLAVEVAMGSLDYRTTLIHDAYVSREVLRAVYAVAVLGALGLSSHRPLRRFGLLVAVSLLAAEIFFPFAFISVWCFFAALLSAGLVLLLVVDRPGRPRVEMS